LLQVQVAQERFFLQNNRYAGASTAADSITELNNAPNLPAAATPGLGISSSTPNGYYTITLVRPTSTTYTVTATAAGPQAGDTDCATWTVDQIGTRTPVNGCWK
jgi:type IV pilus assembly protein PilE